MTRRIPGPMFAIFGNNLEVFEGSEVGSEGRISLVRCRKGCQHLTFERRNVGLVAAVICVFVGTGR